MAHLPPTVQCILFLRFGIVYATQLFDNLTFVTSVSCFYKNMQQLSWNRFWVSLLALLETLPIYSININSLQRGWAALRWTAEGCFQFPLLVGVKK